MKNIDLTPIFQALILLVSSIITLYILPKVKAFLAEKLSTEQRENLKQWVKVAVAAAEQLIKGSGKGEEKKQYVLDFLLSKGITFDTDEVTALIESEVYELTQGSGYIPATSDEPTTEGDTTEKDNIAADEDTETDTENTVEAVG